LKTRTERHAARADHPGQWSSDDAARAQAEANELARPRGERGPTPEQQWQARRPVSAAERALFAQTVARLRDEERALEGEAREGVLEPARARRLERVVLCRALVEHGYLLFSRRRIPLRLRRRKAANIP
jgi:hypothetical protein